ncbi:MAG: right-handed parallel beta-helix repeat-containing protein [Acidimicrobiales bacterium]|nr:right-handed parallel beta-helix repeat-containing protein [Acidimicrobiales bacterium]
MIAAAVGAVGLAASAWVVGPQAAAAQACFAWSGQVPLQQAVDANICVEVQAGTYDLDRYLLIADGRTLQGDPDVPREQIALRARAPWNTNGNEGVITGSQPPHVAVATIRHLTVDANGLATGGLGASDLTIDDVVVRNGRCWGVAIVGPNMTITDSRIEHNGADPACPSPPGAGIYAAANGTAYGVYLPRIIGNEITANTGPAIDVYNVWGGVLLDNDIHDNRGWAAVSLVGSKWTVQGNRIVHAAGSTGQPHVPACNGGPGGPWAAALLLCQGTVHGGVDTGGNLIGGSGARANTIAGFYGVLLIGNDEASTRAVPTGNTIAGNRFDAVTVACADDAKANGLNANAWTGCTPVYF